MLEANIGKSCKLSLIAARLPFSCSDLMDTFTETFSFYTFTIIKGRQNERQYFTRNIKNPAFAGLPVIMAP